MESEPIIQVQSPDGHILCTVWTIESALHMAVMLSGQPVIEASPLNFSIDGTTLTTEATIGAVDRYLIDDTFAWRGAHSEAHNHCEGVCIALSHAGGIDYTLEIRAFNDGMGFRFLCPGDGLTRVPDEATVFNLPKSSTVWYHDLEGHYEGIHDKKDIAKVEAGDWAAPPVTFKLPKGAGYASITEAALVNYAGMALRANGEGGLQLVLGHAHPISYPYRLRYSEEDIARLSQPAEISGEITTPWRVILIGADLNALVNSDVIHNLNDPPDPSLFSDGFDTEWVKPGRAVWRYLDGGDKTPLEMRAFTDWASELGFEHHVIEGFWRDWSEAELKDLIAYSRSKNVGIWLWQHSKNLWDAEERRAFFQTCREVGAAGAKIDFFDREAKAVTDHYHTLLKEAAKSQIMVNFHGSNKPTGESRTYPNELTREGIRGMEYRRTDTRAEHNATLPFTRFLAGHADYTPVHFGDRLADTSWVHQMATAVVFTSSLLTYAAHPQTIRRHPCAQIMRNIPAIWDETIVLPASEIGELAAFARRSDTTWFIAFVNGTTARTVDIPLSFLDGHAYRSILVYDLPHRADEVQIEHAVLRRTEVLSAALRSGGGFIAQCNQS